MHSVGLHTFLENDGAISATTWKQGDSIESNHLLNLKFKELQILLTFYGTHREEARVF